jgi:pyruvate,water dikinase
MGYVLGLDEIDQTRVEAVGGKGANLGELARIDGVRVPDGFCVTTDAFRLIMTGVPSIDELLDRLARVEPADRDAIATLSAKIRRVLEAAPLPAEVTAAISAGLARAGEHVAYAVRSSATAEDLPGASFAGQQDSYLNVVGAAAITEHVRRCWASLFTERAVTYRLRNGFDHRKVHMAVVVQRLIDPDAAGVLFTADPVTSNRRVTTVEAVPGLGEALVSGLVNADSYTVRAGEVTARTVAIKHLALRVSPDGGTGEREIDPERQDEPVLTDEQIVRLAQLGRRIESHFGRPQDIEWCLVDGDFQIVQSRPITTLFPIPATADGDNHVYLSVGHQQMMTDAMKPLGLSVWHLTTSAVMVEAGGRLFVDVTARLAAPTSRSGLLDLVGRSDPLTRDALQTVLDRDGFIASAPDGAPTGPPAGRAPAPAPAPIDTDPAIVTALIEQSEASLAALDRDIRALSGPALFDFMLAAFEDDKRLLFDPTSMQVIMAGMESTWWLDDRLQEWLGERSAADALTRSAPHNVTSEMGLALLDVADVIRPHPEVVAFLHQVEDTGRTDDGFLDELAELAGGDEARDALRAYLDSYGMRCAGEIDITRPRWSECPAALVPTILTNIRTFEPGAGAARFEHGRQQAGEKEQEVLARLRALPDGEPKAAETRRMIERVRTFIGYREYPKYGRVSRAFVYKQALLREAVRLVRNHTLNEEEDIFYLRFDELHEVVRTNRVDAGLIRRRRDEFASYETLSPPRVLTSDGEGIAGAYRRDDLPPGALAGLPVSAGTVEGRARVIVDMARADLEPGDILITAYTDPSWTPLFVTISGLVTEVGGLMTHGAVIAREYGLPAVVGVDRATELIADGQRIRLHASEGYIELLP